MRQRLERSGIRSISAIVDITNYVMLELGQPLHAYDRALLEGDIVVRFARPGEKLLLLNEATLDLETDYLMVCDERKPLGLAGIMGGEYSGIAATTTGRLPRRRVLEPGGDRRARCAAWASSATPAIASSAAWTSSCLRAASSAPPS